jgi:hypothetical protein
MNSTKTLRYSKWIAAAIALIFMCTAVAVVSDSATAAEDDPASTLDVDDLFTLGASLLYSKTYAEPASDATVISGNYDVSSSKSISCISLVDGAVLNFSNSAVLTTDALFIDGNVKLINTDGSAVSIAASKIYLSNFSAMSGESILGFDKTVTIDSAASQSGFYDPATSVFDPSKGIKLSGEASIFTEGTLTITQGNNVVNLYSESGAAAVSMTSSIDLTDMYKSMKEKLDGASLDDIYVVLVDYLYNSLVYPEIAMDMDIANISGAFGKMKGVVVSLKSGQTNKMIEIEADIASSEGQLQCTNLKAGASLSLIKAKVYATADELTVKNDKGYEKPLVVKLDTMNLELSTRGDKIIQVIAENYNPDDLQAMFDSLAASDMDLDSNFKLIANSISVTGNTNADTNVDCTAKGVSLTSDNNTKTGSKVDISVEDLFFKTVSEKDTTVKMNDFNGDLSVKYGKNLLEVFKFVKVIPPNNNGDNPKVDFDKVGAATYLLNGATVKGDVSVGTFESVTNDAVSVNEFSLTGGTGNNFSTPIDAKITTDSATNAFTMTADFEPQFSDKAKLYSKSYQAYGGAFDGNEVTFSKITLDTETLTVKGAIAQPDVDIQSSMIFTMTADVDTKNWESAETGTAAYGQAINMSSAYTKSDINAASVVTPLSQSGRDISISHYTINDRGTEAISSFDDFVSMANVTDTLKGSEYKSVFNEYGTLTSLSTANTVTVLNGTETKYTDISDTKPVAYLVTGDDGYYDITADSSAASAAPIYNIGAAPEPSSGGDNTMLYIAIAIIAIILIALIAYFLMKKRNA